MCNLYHLRKSSAEVARMFSAVDRAGGGNRGEQVYPGYPGLVVAAGQVRQMTWGFPLAQVSRKTGKPLKPKPVNNARADKLAGGFWRHSFEHRRCLIPLDAFAEAEGEAGRKTRTWLSVAGEDTFACAGIWRDSAEWGAVYSMVMTDPAAQTADVHDRMPVILHPQDHALWQNGTPAQAFALCRPFDGLITIDRTDVPWASRPVSATPVA